MESEGRRRPIGAGVGLPAKNNPKGIVEAKVVANLGPRTDDEGAFRQWDLEMVNALAQVRKSNGRASVRIMEFIDRGKDSEDARMGVTSERLSATSGRTLAELCSI